MSERRALPPALRPRAAETPQYYPIDRSRPDLNHYVLTSEFKRYAIEHSQRTPLGDSPKDDEALIQALAMGARSKESYLNVLNGMHGVSGRSPVSIPGDDVCLQCIRLTCDHQVREHSAVSWKDYYLDNMKRIDAQVRIRGALPDV